MPFRYPEFQGDHVAKRLSINCPLVALAVWRANQAGVIRLFLLTISVFLATFVLSPSLLYAEPGLFGSDGYRITRYRGKVPDIAGNSTLLSADQLNQLRLDTNILMLDVSGIRYYDITENGDFITPERHHSIPGAVWLPVIGWGILEPWQQEYMDQSVRKLTGDNFAAPIAVFCKVDCWLGWNVVRRLEAAGYRNLYWFPGGTDVWQDNGLPLQDITPFALSKDLAARVFIGPSF